MRTFLAEKLLAKIMQWTPEEVQRERPLLQALADFKYDEYQQYSPGIRFIESLVRWLRQFMHIEERKTAYAFVKENVVFISGDQISQLVNLAYFEKVLPRLIEQTAVKLGISKYKIKSIVDSQEFRDYKRQALFIGLSDGAKIDLFRRNSGISNEQVSTTYHISTPKALDMLEELHKEKLDQFNSLFLIDDFTASGKSFIRISENKGKVLKLLNSLYGDSGDLNEDLCKLIDIKNLVVIIVFYIATEEALNSIRGEIALWKQAHNVDLFIEVDAIQIFSNDIKSKVLNNDKFIDIARFYYDNSIETKHYLVGKHFEPFLGFNECSLPLILNHNTPNNSLPILWFEEDRKYQGLFPRITRHK